MRRNQALVSPARVSTVVRGYRADLLRRWRILDRVLFSMIAVDDLLGLANQTRVTLQLQPPSRFDFPLDPGGKTEAFERWLRGALDSELLTPAGWQNSHVRAGYSRGVEHADAALRRAGVTPLPGELQRTFNQPIHRRRLELLFARNFRELKGITDTVDQQLSRIVTEALATGQSPREAARLIRRGIQTFGRNRSIVLARTEIIRSHADATLTRFEQSGVEEVQGQAEFLTAQDDRVCPDCAALEGNRFSLEEARGIIPVHPQCRCAWLPVTPLGSSAMSAAQAPAEDVGATMSGRVANVRQTRERLEARRDSLRTEATQLRERFKTSGSAALRRQIRDLDDQVKSTIAELKRLRAQERGLSRGVVTMDRPTRPVTPRRARGGRTPPGQFEARSAARRSAVSVVGQTSDTVDEGVRAFNSMVDKRWLTVAAKKQPGRTTRVGIRQLGADEFQVKFDRDRPFFNRFSERGTLGDQVIQGQTIHYRGSNVANVVHELGHLLESNVPELRDAALAWRARRIKEAGTKTAALGGRYAANEVANPDRFINRYVGKIYEGDKVTEVISVGLEMMYRDPAGFFEADPDHFEFILKIMRGELP